MIRRTPTLVSVSMMALLLTPVVSIAQQSNAPTAVLPLTTRSAKVRSLMDQVWNLALDQVEQAKAIVVLRQAVNIDPNFAMGHQLLAQTSLDPAEQVREQRKAFATRTHATPAEQLVIEWFQDSADHKLIPAITAMNTVLSQYPQDKWVVFLSNLWLTQQTQYERATVVFEHSGLDSPGLLNNTAYTYAFLRQFDKAFALMDKYVAAMPTDANPQDSYAEILRMAGHFDQAIQRYRAALATDPEFYSSQFGIADTYSLMGDQNRARKEYAIGFHKFPLPELHRIQWQTREAITFIREGNFSAADHAFQAIANHAHSKQMSQVEADTYRQMAMYQRHPKQALAFLAKAEAAMDQGKNTMPAALQQELAQILRARVEADLNLGNKRLAGSALRQLERMSQGSDDKLIDTAYHGAAGAVRFSEHKYADAVSHLEEDPNNPLSLRLLAVAYQRIGDNANAQRTNETLANLNDPSLEQALVVPAFRTCNQDPNCSSGLKNASLKQ